MELHVSSLVNTGVSAVLDFPANTVENQSWIRGILEATNAFYQMHVLEVPDELCLARLRQRNTGGEHPFAVTDEQFRRFSKHFVRPSSDEGFNLAIHDGTG